MRKKKQVLSLNFDVDFLLLGIICSHKDYRLCYEINHCLGIDLKREADLDIIGKNQQKSEFALFGHQVDEEKNLYVFSNKNGISFLIPEQHQVDYFMMLKGAGYRKDHAEEVRTKLKASKIIMGVYHIDPLTLKSKEHLIF